MTNSPLPLGVIAGRGFMPLRDYQKPAVIRCIQRLGNNPLLVAPTGSGKTTMGAAIAHAYHNATRKPVLWIAHRHELLDQARQRLGESIRVESVQALCRRPGTDAGLLVFDEAHRSVAKSYRTVVERHPNAKILGLTATPFRTDGRGLGSVYGEIVEAATTSELIKNGTLIDPTVYVVKPPDTSGLRVRYGDYATGEIEHRANTPEQRACIVSEYDKRLRGCRTLAFACSIAHSMAIVEALSKAGVKAEHVDGETPRRIREYRTEQLRNGDIDVLSNVELFTEGFDLPAIDGLIIARPTASLAMHLQMVGRAMRRADAKFLAYVHDHAGNHLRHGTVSRQLTYTLDDATRVTSSSSGTGLRMCPECYRLNPLSSTSCLSCEYIFTPDADVPDIGGGGVLVQLTPHQVREAYFDRLCEEEVAYGRKPGAKFMKFKERFGDYPATVDIDGAEVYINPDTATRDIKKLYYEQQLSKCIEKGWKPGAASHRYKDVFGVFPQGFVTEVKQRLLTPEDEFKEMWG